MQVYLGVGMGASDRLDLMDGTNYYVLPDGFRVDDDAADHRYVYVTLHLHVRGISKNAMLNARSAILTKLNQATIAGDGINDWVMLGVQLTGADSMVWWRVVEGGITEPGTLRGVYGNYIGSENGPLVLTLRCWKGAFGQPIIDDPVAITGDNPTLYRAGIPGGMPAYAEMVLTDTSENDAVIHGIGIGSRSAIAMDAGDFVPFQPVEATGIGSEDEDADSFTGEIVTASPGVQWQAMAYVQPAEEQMRGAYDLWLRVRDEGRFLPAPRGLTAMSVTGASLRQSVSAIAYDRSVTVTVDQPTMPGNTLLLKVWGGATSGTASIESVPPGFSLVRSSVMSGRFVALYCRPDADAVHGDLTVTLAAYPGSPSNALQVAFEEWDGLASSPVDVTASNTSSSSTTHTTGTTAAATAAHSVAMTMHIWGSHPFVDYTAGYSAVQSGQFKVGPVTRYFQSMYRLFSGSTTQSATLTIEDNDNAASLIAVFTAATSGDLSGPDNYQYRVVAIDTDGHQSAASATIAIHQPSESGGATRLEWQPSTSPHVAQYRVYVRKGTDVWSYWDTGSATPAFLHTTMSNPDGTANPPDIGTEVTQVRVGLALGPDGRITHRSAVVQPRLANGQWEWLRVSSEVLSPLPRPAGMPQPDYRIVVEARHPTNGDGIAVDVIAFAPSDESWADVRVSALTAAREWVIGTNHAGQGYAWTRDPADGGDPSGATMTGRLAIGPGDTKLMFMLRGRNGVSLVEDASAAVQLTIYPRYHWLIGNT